MNMSSVDPSTEKDLEPGDEVYIEQLYVDEPMAIQVGKTYMASLFYDYEESLATDQDIYRLSHSPVSSQCDPATGELLEGSLLPRATRRMDEVTADFWEPGGLGEVWMRWVEQLGQSDRHWLPVLPTGGLAVLPAFHDKTAYITRGREITAEEFDAGDRVCLLSSQVALGSGIRIGDKIRLPMQFALYGFKPGRLSPLQFALGYFYSPLNTRGEVYEPFFDAEYEVVGFYSMTGTPTNELVAGDAIIVPKRSIAASDENNIVWYTPMNNWNTSFQIPNGTIASFNSALHDAVPGSMQLQLVYDDNGYEEIADSLTTARLRSFLLLGVGTLAAGAVIVLLLYFFVWKEKKRTALEQAMGMPHTGSYLSLMAGILAVAIPAVMLGSGLSALAHEVVTHPGNTQQSVLPSAEKDDLEQELEQLSFSREYSLWAQNERNAEEIPLDTMEVKAQTGIYFLFPLGILLLTGGLALLLVHRTLRMELINLLNVQRE